MYHVDTQTGLLTEASKNIAKRGHDGPRHSWPHPNGKIVYSLQEHSSVRLRADLSFWRIWGLSTLQYVDVLQLSEDGQRLEWLEGVNILPEDVDCNLFWADGEQAVSCHFIQLSEPSPDMQKCGSPQQPMFSLPQQEAWKLIQKAT